MIEYGTLVGGTTGIAAGEGAGRSKDVPWGIIAGVAGAALVVWFLFGRSRRNY